MPLHFKNSYKFLPYIIIFVGILLSAFSGWFSYQYYKEKEQLHLEFGSNEIVTLIKARMAAYEQVLKSGVGFFKAAKSVTRDEWAIFVKEHKLSENFKGVQGFGYSEIVLPNEKQKHEERIRKKGFANFKIHPEGQREFYTSIIYLEPFDERNKRAFGYDMFSEKVRADAMTKAIQSGGATLSGKITLVQEYDKDIQAGFLMYLPLYKKGFKLESAQDRAMAIQGFIYAPFRVNDFMSGILGAMFPEIDFEIYDGNFAKKENLLYDSGTNHQNMQLYKTTNITMNGRTWTLQFKANCTLKSENLYIVFLLPSLILILTLLLYLLLNSLIKAEESALQATENLHASEERLRFALEGAGDGLWDWNVKTDKLYVSKRWKEMFGYEENEIGDTIDVYKNMLHPEDSEQVYADIKAHMQGRSDIYTNEHRVKCKDGSYKWILDRGVIVSRDMDGSPTRMVGSCSDITERKKMQQELELKEEMMISQSRQAAMGDMVAMIAHQWRQPITVISMVANNIIMDIELEEEITPQELKKMTATINEQTQQLSQTIDDFRNFFKPNQEKVQTTLASVIEGTLKIVGKSLENNNIAVTVENKSETKLLTYPSQLLQVFLNLLGNAKDILIDRKVSDAKVHITIKESQDSIVATICDNGGGIPKDVIKRLGEPYFTTKERNGTGLGLYMSITIVQKHLNGSLTWKNKNNGACFSVTLPKE